MRRSRNTDSGYRVTWTPSHIPVIGCSNALIESPITIVATYLAVLFYNIKRPLAAASFRKSPLGRQLNEPGLYLIGHALDSLLLPQAILNAQPHVTFELPPLEKRLVFLDPSRKLRKGNSASEYGEQISSEGPVRQTVCLLLML
jgi:hypothetical protein